MDGLLALTGQFIEEERYAGKEHHNAVENGVEEQQQYSCLQTLLRFRHQICGLDITDDGIITLKYYRSKRLRDRAADHGKDTDDER